MDINLYLANDLVTYRKRDDVLTLLINLGYLAYDGTQGKAYIPNEEMWPEFAKIIREMKQVYFSCRDESLISFFSAIVLIIHL